MGNNQEDKQGNSGQKKDVTIIVNGVPHPVEKAVISYAEVVALAFDNPPTGENVLFTITYRRGHGEKPDDILKKGESVKVKDKMIFDVTPTDKS